MQTRTLGADGPPVGCIAFGGMPLSMELEIGDRPDEATAVAVIRAAVDAGATLLDTADVYSRDDGDIGHNERLFAKALADLGPAERDRLVVATKGGLRHPERRKWHADGRPEHLRAACDASLRALGVERIDLYQLHAPDPKVPFAESVGALAELREAGKIRWVGLSNVGIRQIEAARRIVPIRTVQNFVSPFCRDSLRRRRWILPSVAAHCRRLGIALLGYSPLGGIHLNKSLPEQPVLRAVAERHGCSPHAAVVAWVLAQGPHVLPIVAARREAHVRDSMSAADVRLTPSEVRAIGKIAG